MKTGRYNAVTDVAGIRAGHYTERRKVCGTTVILCPEGAVTGVDVRGAAPGTRETDLLDPVNVVEKVQAVVLTGGSVFGLTAADGALRWLAERGYGFPLENNHVAPIVPAAVLYDLGRGPDFVPPVTAEWGYNACEQAGTGPLPCGTIGAGTGAMSGGIKGGLGTASIIMADGITVGAVAAVNSLGSVIDPQTGRPWEIGRGIGGEFGDKARRAVVLPDAPPGQAGRNTTIGLVATDAALSKVQAKKIAQMAHDGMARAIRPCHTLFDGDTIFCMATGRHPLPETPGFFAVPHAQAITELGHAAAECVSRAIMHAILDATGLGGMTAWRDLESKRD